MILGGEPCMYWMVGIFTHLLTSRYKRFVKVNINNNKIDKLN